MSSVSLCPLTFKSQNVVDKQTWTQLVTGVTTGVTTSHNTCCDCLLLTPASLPSCPRTCHASCTRLLLLLPVVFACPLCCCLKVFMLFVCFVCPQVDLCCLRLHRSSVVMKVLPLDLYDRSLQKNEANVGRSPNVFCRLDVCHFTCMSFRTLPVHYRTLPVITHSLHIVRVILTQSHTSWSLLCYNR